MNDSVTNDDAPSTLTESIATVKMVNLPAGTYKITVTGGASEGASTDQLVGPALQVSTAPVLSQGTIEFVPGPGTLDRWLQRRTDFITARIRGGNASLLLTSLRLPDAPAMSIDIQRIAHAEASSQDGNWLGDEAGAPLVPLDVLAHISRLGDISFASGPAGSPDGTLWIEGFAIDARGFPASEIFEYSAVRADGVLVPWLDGGSFCGSRGMGLGLTGFALRIKPMVAHAYDCAYSARFASGLSCDWLHDGELCQSDVPDDPIISMEVRIFEHRAARRSGAGETAIVLSPEA